MRPAKSFFVDMERTIKAVDNFSVFKRLFLQPFFILIFFLFFFWLQYVIIKNKIIQRMNFKWVQHLERQYLESRKFEHFLVQRVIDGELIPSIMSPEKINRLHQYG